jgi:hypothetical protein
LYLDIQQGPAWAGLFIQRGASAPTSAGTGQAGITLNQTVTIQIARTSQTLIVRQNGAIAFTSTQTVTNEVSQINRAVFCVYDGQATISEIDNFSCSGVTDTFSTANSSNWKFHYELPAVGSNTPNWQPNPVTQQVWTAGAQAIQGGIANGVMRLGPGGQASWPGAVVFADFARPLSGDFVMQFDYTRRTPEGDFRIIFPIGVSSAVNVIPVTTLFMRFNRRSGKVEVVRNGVFTRRGFMQLQYFRKTQYQLYMNRRQRLRKYR